MMQSTRTLTAINKSLFVAGLIALLLSLVVHFPRISVGSPYESWDEPWSWFSSFALSGEESAAYLSYGSLDTAVFVVANTWYGRFDPVGRKHPPFFYLNHFPGSWDDPDYFKKDLSMAQWVRGIKDRQPIFIARKIYFALACTVLLGAILLCFGTIGTACWPLVWSMVVLANNPDWSFQATQALPNATIASLAVLSALSAALFMRQRQFAYLCLSAACVAFASNFKIDGLMLGVIPAAALLLSANRQSLKQLPGRVLILGCCFAVSFALTRWRFVYDPVGALQNIVRGLRVHMSWDGAGAFPLSERLEWVCSYAARTITGSSVLSFAETALVLFLPTLFLAGALMVLWRQASREAFRQSVLLFASGAFFFAFYILVSPGPFDRYFLRAFAVVVASLGFLASVGIASRQNTVRRTASIAGVVLILVAGLGVVRALPTAGADLRSVDPATGLDLEHSRNRASLEILGLIDVGRFSDVVLVDQHANVDLRPFLIRGLKPRYINAENFEEMLGSCLNSPEPCLVIWSPGTYRHALHNDYPRRWSKDEEGRYDQYLARLQTLPELWRTGVENMKVLSLVPNAHDDIVVISIYAGATGRTTR